jgi:hypothetical protein
LRNAHRDRFRISRNHDNFFRGRYNSISARLGRNLSGRGLEQRKDEDSEWKHHALTVTELMRLASMRLAPSTDAQMFHQEIRLPILCIGAKSAKTCVFKGRTRFVVLMQLRIRRQSTHPQGFHEFTLSFNRNPCVKPVVEHKQRDVAPLIEMRDRIKPRRAHGIKRRSVALPRETSCGAFNARGME